MYYYALNLKGHGKSFFTANIVLFICKNQNQIFDYFFNTKPTSKKFMFASMKTDKRLITLILNAYIICRSVFF